MNASIFLWICNESLQWVGLRLHTSGSLDPLVCLFFRILRCIISFQIRDGRFQWIDQCLVREYRMICHVIRGDISRDIFEVQKNLIQCSLLIIHMSGILIIQIWAFTCRVSEQNWLTKTGTLRYCVFIPQDVKIIDFHRAYTSLVCVVFQWEPSRLDLVTDSMVDGYFSKVDDKGWEDLKLPSRTNYPPSTLAKL